MFRYRKLDPLPVSYSSRPSVTRTDFSTRKLPPIEVEQRGEIDRLKRMVWEKDNVFQQQKIHIGTLKEQHAQTRSELNQVSHDLTMTRIKYDSLRSQLESSNKTKEYYVEQYNWLHIHLASERIEVSRHRTDKLALEMQLSKHKNDLAQVELTMEHLRTNLINLTDENEQLRSVVSDLETELAPTRPNSP